MDDDADAKMILMAPPPENWKRPLGRPHITWLYTIQRDLRAYILKLNEAVDPAGVYIGCYALLVVHARKQEVIGDHN